MPNSSFATELLEKCNAALKGGADFPTILQSIIKKHPYVTSLPIQDIKDGQPCLRIELLGGKSIYFGNHGFYLD